jgi:hypothetical protein
MVVTAKHPFVIYTPVPLLKPFCGQPAGNTKLSKRTALPKAMNIADSKWENRARE